MLIFSVSFQFFRMSPRRGQKTMARCHSMLSYFSVKSMAGCFRMTKRRRAQLPARRDSPHQLRCNDEHVHSGSELHVHHHYTFFLLFQPRSRTAAHDPEYANVSALSQTNSLYLFLVVSDHSLYHVSIIFKLWSKSLDPARRQVPVVLTIAIVNLLPSIVI
jgi:hypothetical protein